MKIQDLKNPKVISGGLQKPAAGGFDQPEQYDQPVKSTGFGRRLALSFGGEEAQKERALIEQQTGNAGKLDVGDIADVAGKTLPFIGATLGGILGGGVGSVPAAAGGAAAGEAVRRGIGKFLGTNEDSLGRDVAEVAKEGAYTYVGGKLLQGTGKYVASRFPKFLGLATGENPNLIKVALENPKVADQGIKQGDAALRAAVEKAGATSLKMKTAFIRGHAESMKNEIFKDMTVTKGWNRMAKQEIQKKFEGMLRANRVKMSPEGLDFSTSTIKANPGEVGKIQDAYRALQDWRNFSQFGVHKLKQLVGEFTKFPTEVGGTAKSPFLKNFYGYLDDQVKRGLPVKRVKAYEALNKKFADNIGIFDDMVDAFNHGDPFQKLATIMGENKDSLRQILEFYEKTSGEKILPIIAGRAISGERQAAFGLLNPREWIDFFYSPGAQAKTVTSLGRLAPKLKEGVKKVAPSIYTGVSEGVRKLENF